MKNLVRSIRSYEVQNFKLQSLNGRYYQRNKKPKSIEEIMESYETSKYFLEDTKEIYDNNKIEILF